MLVNPNNPIVTRSTVTDLQAAVSAIGGQIEVLPAGTDGDIDAAFASLVRKQVGALLAPGS